MTTERVPMLADDRAATALEFLTKSDAEFADGDRRQASEKLWGAATQALMAAAQQQNWPYGSHQALKAAACRRAQRPADSNRLPNRRKVPRQLLPRLYDGF